MCRIRLRVTVAWAPSGNVHAPAFLSTVHANGRELCTKSIISSGWESIASKISLCWASTPGRQNFSRSVHHYPQYFSVHFSSEKMTAMGGAYQMNWRFEGRIDLFRPVNEAVFKNCSKSICRVPPLQTSMGLIRCRFIAPPQCSERDQI